MKHRIVHTLQKYVLNRRSNSRLRLVCPCPDMYIAARLTHTDYLRTAECYAASAPTLQCANDVVAADVPFV
jgi:hypothetical protein